MIVLFFISCDSEQVLVVSDPYIEAIHGGAWPLSESGFAFRAAFSGFNVDSVTPGAEEDLFVFLESLEKQIDAIVISPWQSLSASDAAAAVGNNNIRIITAGGAANLPISGSIVSVQPDRSVQMRRLGKLAGEWADRTGLPAVLLYNSSKETNRTEAQLLQNGYTDVDKTVPRMRIFDVAGEEQGTLPPDFITAASEASILLLFAGALNPLAMEATDEAAPPVITEYLYDSTAWSERIAASVEQDQKALKRAIMAELKKSSPDGTRYYPARVNKGHLYRMIRKNGLTLLSSQTYNSARR
ncbi:MAG: hypothetical protein RQ801_08775 [Spirochaetaceae bacterium]|nr:hypothetical protein [Spirochaetaceae bacterium]MDT8298378.1 hypothetical protein [Spirochaetaceae bacterium]